jgi:endoribonuclease Dicer
VSKTGSREQPEYFIDLSPELCQLKIIGFSKDIGSSISLLPSIMHRLENLLVAIELKHTNYLLHFLKELKLLALE